MGTLISGSTGIDKIQNNAVDIADLSATGTPGTNFLRGDNTWADALPTQSGNAGKFLTTDASTASWAEGVGGKILQVVTYQYRGNITTTSTTFVDAALVVNITPASTDNKVLIMITCGISPGSAGAWGTIERTVGVTETNLGGATEGFSGWGANSGVLIGNISYLDSPSTTSEVTYKFQCRSGSGGTIEFSYASQGQQSIIAIEVAG